VNKNSSIAVAQLGARMHYAVPRILSGAGYLDRLYTDISINHGFSQAVKYLPSSINLGFLSKLRGRDVSGVPFDKVSVSELIGYWYAYKLREARTEQDRLAAYIWAEERFSKSVLNQGIIESEAIYAFNGASLHIFREAKQKGIKCFLEQTIAPKRIENEILSDAAKIQGYSHDTHHKLMSKFIDIEEEEWCLADKILCASDFVKDGLIKCGVNPNKCSVVSYGVTLDKFEILEKNHSVEADSRPLTVLFVGAVGLRKGIWTLLEAMSSLMDLNITCRIIGTITTDKSTLFKMCPPNTQIIGAVPRSAIPGELMNADIFCLPSLCEGSATVIYEALAAGIPVVTTYNSGSLVRDGVEGKIVPHSDAKALAEAIRDIAEDKSYLERLSINAKNRSVEGSLESYAKRLLAELSLDTKS